MWIEPAKKSLESDMENELEPLMRNITLLRENADNYLQENRGGIKKEEGKSSDQKSQEQF